MLPQKSDEWRNNVSIWETADLPLPLPDNKLWLMLGRGGVGTQLFRLSQNDKPSLVDTPIARFLRFVRAPVATALFFYVYDNVGFEIFQKSKRIENCLVFCRELIIQYWFFHDLASSRVKRLTDLNCKFVLVIIQDFLPPAHATVVLLGCGKFCGRLGLLTWFTSFRINENFVEDTNASTMATREPSKGNFAKWSHIL